MKIKTLFVAATLAGMFNCANAFDAAAPFHLLVGGGLTAGGDKLATVQYSDGSSSNISAGGLVAIYAGGAYSFTSNIAVEATIGYHYNDRNARNGDLRFERFPIDLMGVYGVTDRIRIGLGIEYPVSPRLTGSGVESGTGADMNATAGPLLQAEYLITPRVGVSLRYAAPKYRISGTDQKINGSYGAVLASYYF